MGASLCPIFRDREVKVLYIGLDAAGKTTLLFRLKLGEVVTTIPTIGFNVETVEHNGVKMSTWDVGSRDKMRPLWRHYYDAMDAIVFLMDSSDKERLQEAVDELSRVVLEFETRHVPLLVLANKQDKDQVLSPDEVKAAILDTATQIPIPWEVFPTSAVTGEGVTPALDWLTSQLAMKVAKKSILAPVTEPLYNSLKYPTSALKSSLRTLSGLFGVTQPAEDGKVFA